MPIQSKGCIYMSIPPNSSSYLRFTLIWIYYLNHTLTFFYKLGLDSRILGRGGDRFPSQDRGSSIKSTVKVRSVIVSWVRITFSVSSLELCSIPRFRVRIGSRLKFQVRAEDQVSSLQWVLECWVLDQLQSSHLEFRLEVISIEPKIGKGQNL